MIALVLAALSGLSYGASDFCGAFASQKNEATLVTAAMQVVSLVALIIGVIVWGDASPTGADFFWGAIGGLGAALGLVTFYKALAQGPMATAASLTALWSAGIPVIAGLILGDRPGPITLIGIAIAVPAAVLVSVGGLTIDRMPTDTTPRERVAGLTGSVSTRTLAITAGLGFGLFFIALSRTSADSGLYPLMSARAASILGLALVVTAQSHWAPIARRWWLIIAITGVLDFAANAFYLTALKHGSFTWVAAISSLYPVSTVLLARIVLDEKLMRLQVYGLGMAGLALTLVGVGATG
jgi:drug/metabolite transporter (DMT)-like permease